ncbi:MAG: hypothetical protein M1821_001570 [Bathelium mastoideum]|nr:MAG: hypothetical protein M1821_001570 [Bathelium mastoideum]
MSSSSSARSGDASAEASSSRQAYTRRDEAHELDQSLDADVLATDPLNGNLSEGISFKRKQKSRAGLIPQFLSSPFSSTTNTPSPRLSPKPATNNRASRRPAAETLHPSPSLSSSSNELLATDPPPTATLLSQTPTNADDPKDTHPLDWYVEGPGRRVGYDDLTAIDWIFEYAKERQRLRSLSASAKGLVGWARRAGDAAQIWVVLVGTGMAAGLVAAGIDIASDWLGDWKSGFCSSRFYLNAAFCCWGHDFSTQCKEWVSWSSALGVHSKGGSWIIEYLFFTFYSVLFAILASVLVVAYAVYAKHSGIPEIKTVLGGFVIRRFMGAWVLVIKSLGLCLAVASGLWLGKEGPLVHVACCCANLFMKLSPAINDNEARKREVLSAAAAAGISVAFGAPVGGVLFSLEQLSYYFPDKTMWQSFVCAMVAAVTLQFTNPFRTGKLVLYQVTYHTGWHGFEIVPFAFLGIIGGLYGGLFIKVNMKINEWRQSSGFLRNSILFHHPVAEVASVALLTAIVAYPIKFMRAQSSELVYTLFAECVDLTEDLLGLCKSGIANTGVIFLLLVCAFLGFLFAALTFGLELPAGIILPSMAIGALYGRVVGLIVEVWQRDHPNAVIFANCEPDVPCVTPGTYAIIGAASALGGATRMTVSIVVIMFELTGALTYVLPIMIAVMISKWVGDAFGKRGIYESWIHFKEYPFIDNRDEVDTVPDVPASQIMTRVEDLVVITATGHTIASLDQLLLNNPFRGFPVITDRDDGLLLGYISRTELAYALSSAMTSRCLPNTAEAYFAHQPLADPGTTLDLRPWMDQTPITLNSRCSLQLAVNMFLKLGLRYVLFTHRGLMQGLLTKKDIWYLLNGAEEGREGAGVGRDGGIRPGVGVLREERDNMDAEERGLLGEQTDGVVDDTPPGDGDVGHDTWRPP